LIDAGELAAVVDAAVRDVNRRRLRSPEEWRIAAELERRFGRPVAYGGIVETITLEELRRRLVVTTIPATKIAVGG
jgi:hypothetical protein